MEHESPLDELEQSPALTPVSAGKAPPKQRRKKLAQVWLDLSVLPEDWDFGTVQKTRKAPSVEDGKVVETEVPWEGCIIGMGQLTVEEQLIAVEAAAGQQARVRIEMIKLSLRTINGRPVDHSVEEGDSIFRALGMQAQTFLVEAFNRVTQPPKGAIEVFDRSFRFE